MKNRSRSGSVVSHLEDGLGFDDSVVQHVEAIVLIEISMNAPILCDYEGLNDPLHIAQKELREKKIPLIVRRYLPDGW
jgi:hypothetical protein